MVRLVSAIKDSFRDGKRKKSILRECIPEILHVLATMITFLEKIQLGSFNVKELLASLRIASVGSLVLFIVHLIDARTSKNTISSPKRNIDNIFSSSTFRHLMRYEYYVSLLFVLASIIDISAKNFASKVLHDRHIYELTICAVCSIFLFGCLVNESLSSMGKPLRVSNYSNGVRSCVLSCFIVGLVIRWYLTLLVFIESGASELSKNMIERTHTLADIVILCGSLGNLIRVLRIHSLQMSSDRNRLRKGPSHRGGLFTWFKGTRSDGSESMESISRDYSDSEDDDYHSRKSRNV